MKKMMVYMI